MNAPSGKKPRVPPGQKDVGRKWPVLHAGDVPRVDLCRWRFRVFGRVKSEVVWTWEEFQALPKVTVCADMHCVTTWTRLDNVWEGVSFKEIYRRVEVLPEARFVLAHAYPSFTANLPLAALLDDDVLFAYAHGGSPLTPDHGWPLRLVVPKRYAWKSAKWVTGIEFLSADRPGFWEQMGYHMSGDPWKEERMWGD